MSTNTTDQLGNLLTFNSTPQRVISLVPSNTELLHYLIPSEKVVGITKFCIKPNSWFTSKARVGGTKNIAFDTIKKLNPDLIIANKEENEKYQIEELSKLYPVWVSEVNTLKDAYHLINELGTLLEAKEKAVQLIKKIKENFKSFTPIKVRLKVAYFIWNNPKMVVGNNNFINHLLKKCGFENAFSSISRYPQVSDKEILKENPDIIFLSSEPFPFKEKHVSDFQNNFPNSKIYLVDGELFSWYGPRLLESASYFTDLIKKITVDFDVDKTRLSTPI